MKRRFQQIENLAVGIVGLVLVSRLVSPRNNAAAIIEAMGSSVNLMVKVATAETAIGKRERRSLRLLGEMSDEQMTYLFAGLTDSDLDWVEEMLRDA